MPQVKQNKRATLYALNIKYRSYYVKTGNTLRGFPCFVSAEDFSLYALHDNREKGDAQRHISTPKITIRFKILPLKILVNFDLCTIFFKGFFDCNISKIEKKSILDKIQLLI